MKVVILAAGIGKRLNSSTDHLPKPLTELGNGMSIMEYQLSCLASFMPLDQVVVVVGYHKEEIIEKFPFLTYIYNPLFAQENTSKSLLRALNEIDDDVLWLNGDVIFRPAVLQQILAYNRTAMLVNRTVVGEEEVKYRADAEGKIFDISKQVQEGQGEALGINFFKREDLTLFKTYLKLCQPQDYFEKAIELAIKKEGLAVWSVSIASSDCMEIDFPQDLIRANQLLYNWESSKAS